MSETPSEIAVLRAALAVAEARAAAAEEELTQARAVVSASDAMIRHLQLQIPWAVQMDAHFAVSFHAQTSNAHARGE